MDGEGRRGRGTAKPSVTFSTDGLKPGAAREIYLMSRTRQCLLFALILIAALLSAVLRLVLLVPVPKRPKRQESKSQTRINKPADSVAREEVAMSKRARSAFNAALDGATLGFVVVAAGMLALWWWMLAF